MNAHDSELEKLGIPIAVGLPLHHFDLAVCLCNWARGDGVSLGGEAAESVPSRCPGHDLQWTYPRSVGPGDPIRDDLIRSQTA